MWSIIQRELREQARQPLSYWLRLLGAMALLLAFWLAWHGDQARPVPNGRGYFIGLNRLLFVTIWLIGPVLTADCLSREKREGTLGLLFLTPLSALDVVLGKGFVFTLRAFTVVLAAGPVLLVPVLIGGVSWPDASRMMLMHAAALVLALVAGLLASSFTTSWIRARLLAVVLAVAAGVFFVVLHVVVTSVIVWQGLSGPASLPLDTIIERNFDTAGFRLALLLRQPSYFWRDLSLGGGSGWSGVRFATLILGLTLLLVAVTIWVATRAVKLTWQTAPLSPHWEKRVRFFTDVRVSRGWFRRQMRRLMDFNPMWWRQSSTWSARVTTLGWLGLVMMLFTGMVSGGRSVHMHWLMERLLLLGVAFSAASSFRSERESGAMELLLVTGLSPERMLRGRLYALAVQFAPAALIVWGLPALLALSGMDPPRRNVGSTLELMWPWGVVWLLPTAMLGISLSLSHFSFLTAFILTFLAQPIVWFVRILTAGIILEPLRLGSDQFLWTLTGILEAAAVILVSRIAWQGSIAQLERRTFMTAKSKETPSEP